MVRVVLQALEGTVDILKVMDAEAKAKVAREKLEKAESTIMDLEEELQKLKQGDVKKSSFAQKMLDLKKENR